MSKEKLTTQVSKSKSLASKGKQNELANANSYRHFLAAPTTGHNYISWAFGLRSHKSFSQSSKTTPAPPQTFYKTVEGMKVFFE